MTKKQYPKLTISLRKEDEELILKLRSFYEQRDKKQYSLADVVRCATKRCVQLYEI